MRLLCRVERRTGLSLGLAMLLAVATFSPALVHVADAAAHSTNVAYITDFGTGINDPKGPNGGVSIPGSSILVNNITGSPPASGVYTTASGSVTHFKDVSVAIVESQGVAALSSFDTVMMYELCDVGAHPKLVSALNAYLSVGDGKVVIYDGDRCAPVGSGPGAAGAPDYSQFLFPFASSNPGPRGAAGTVTLAESEALPATLTRGVSLGPTGGDEIGDSNTFTSNTGGWCAALEGTNVLGVSGIQVGYARTPGGGLAIYDGQDNWFTFGPNAFDKKLFDNILDQPVKPDALPCGVPVTGIKLDPLTATNQVGTSHTVTATVANSAGNAVPKVTVTFKVQTGPNKGLTGTGVTDAAGQATFTYTDSGGVGTDTIVASFVGAGVTHTSNVATKIWATTAPMCILTAVLAGPPKQLQITVQDSNAGLKTVVVTESLNTSVSVPAFSVGTTSPVVVTASKVDQSKSSAVALQVTDQAGNVTNCDPALLSVGSQPGVPRVESVHHVARDESKVTIYNGAPGLTRLALIVDGKRLEITDLEDGEQRQVDVSQLMRRGSNTVMIVAQGKAAGSATVLLTE